MKSAKLFLAGMYVYLVLIAAVPFCVLRFGWYEERDTFSTLLLSGLALTLSLHALGWVSAAMSALAYRRWETDRLLAAWRLLKLGAIPFHVLNFILAALILGTLTAIFRELTALLLTLLLPIPLIALWLLVVQSGITGWLAIRSLREEGEDVFILHSAAQFFPVLDVASTLLLLRRSARTPNP